MNEFTPEHAKAFAIAGIITAVLAVGAAMFVLKSELLQQVVPPGGGQPPANGEQQKVLEEAVRGFIKTLPSYDSQAQPPLTFAGQQFLADNVRQVRMDSERMLQDVVVQQHYRVYEQDGRIISHEVWHSVAGLQVKTPEPEQIVPGQEFVVRGDSMPLASVTISLADLDAPEIILAESLVTSEQDGSYAATFRRVAVPSSRLLVTVRTGDSFIRIPVVLDTYAQSN